MSMPIPLLPSVSDVLGNSTIGVVTTKMKYLRTKPHRTSPESEHFYLTRADATRAASPSVSSPIASTNRSARVVEEWRYENTQNVLKRVYVTGVIASVTTCWLRVVEKRLIFCHLSRLFDRFCSVDRITQPSSRKSREVSTWMSAEACCASSSHC